MSSDLLARVEAIYGKAAELSKKGHVVRAAENYGRAAEAARALGADNIVAVSMDLQQGVMLSAYCTAAPQGTADPRTIAAHRAQSIALLSGAVTALERRRVAGTLLEGKCAAAEEAWFARVLRRLNVPPAEAASQATISGYEQFVQAASAVMLVLMDARSFAAVCSAAQFQAFAQHVVHAAELMQQPRRRGESALNNDAQFAFQLRSTVARGAATGLDARLVQLLAGAWERLQHSGVLQAVRVEERVGTFISAGRPVGSAIQSSLNAPGMRHCALPGCGAKEAHPAHFKSCAACRAVVYCSREHQVEGWPSHKKACKAARKAAADDDAGGASSA